MNRLCLAVCFFAATGLAGEPRTMPELTPRKVQFDAAELPLQEVLKAIEKQTGNTIADRRGKPDNPTLKLPANPSTFWQTLDTLGLGFSAYQPDGGVALVDTPYRKLPTHYSGLFRFTFKRIAVSRDEEAAVSSCQVTLDTAWEPRFQPLYINLEKAEVRFGKQSEKLERQAMSNVAGAGAAEIELRMRAPDRKVLKIDELQGNLRVIGVPRMLEFRFAKLTAGTTAMEDGVKVRLAGVDQSSKSRWSVDLETLYPPGWKVQLDSFQDEALLDNNRVWLSWTDPKTGSKQTLEPSGANTVASKSGIRVSHHFTPNAKTSLPPSSAAVTLHYRTPNRVVAIAVSFAFADLPLP